MSGAYPNCSIFDDAVRRRPAPTEAASEEINVAHEKKNVISTRCRKRKSIYFTPDNISYQNDNNLLIPHLMNKQHTILNYTDYRSFLKAYGEHKKAQTRNWSYSKWARELGFSSTAVLTNILNGKRHPGLESLKLFQNYFDWPEKESHYFADLVKLQKVMDDPQLASLLLEKLKKSNPKAKFTIVNDDIFQILSKPLYPSLREMLHLQDFKEDLSLIQGALRFKSSKAEIKRALSLLVEAKLISRNSSGALESTQENIDTGSDYNSEALKQYHENMMELAKESIRSVGSFEREVSGVSFCFRKSDMLAAKKALRDFRQDFITRFENKIQNDDVYQLNIHFFPLTETSKIKDNQETNND